MQYLIKYKIFTIKLFVEPQSMSFKKGYLNSLKHILINYIYEGCSARFHAEDSGHDEGREVVSAPGGSDNFVSGERILAICFFFHQKENLTFSQSDFISKFTTSMRFVQKNTSGPEVINLRT